MIDYNSQLNREVVQLKPSGIRRFFDIANEMDEVISLSIGEPDFSTPWHVRQEGIHSLEEGKTWYSPNRGFLELRDEISKWFDRHYGVTYDSKTQVLVTVGGSEAIDLCIRALVNPGEEVLIPEPSFVCYVPLTEMAGGVPVHLPLKAENEFRLTADELRRAITPRTKALILAFPNNPTGAVMEKSDLEAVADVLRGTNIAVISDEIYGELTYEGVHTSIALLDGMRERTIVVGGFSKSHAMTGWRLGSLLAPSELTAQMFKIHQYGIMCAPTTSQFAAVDALAHGDADIEQMKNEYNRRRRLILDGLAACGIACFPPKGAFYVFPEIGTFGLSSEEFCTRLIDEENVALVPGSAFGESGEGFARVSYAYSVRHIEKALERIARFVQRLK